MTSLAATRQAMLAADRRRERMLWAGAAVVLAIMPWLLHTAFAISIKEP